MKRPVDLAGRFLLAAERDLEGVKKYKTTRYFRNEVLRKRPYIKLDWCMKIVENPVRKEVQPDGRVRHWGFVRELSGRALRVVTLPDEKTIHNAFPDRDFQKS